MEKDPKRLTVPHTAAAGDPEVITLKAPNAFTSSRPRSPNNAYPPPKTARFAHLL
ncbi:MAG: hypothetical protein Q9175_003866, partial [Cornicularia normoerica]